MKLEDVFALMHDRMARSLVEKLEDGTITPAEMAIARQFLKDNGISGLPEGDSPLQSLVDKLPEFDDEDNVVPMSSK